MELVNVFQSFGGILIVCPCCGEVLRLGELQLRYRGKNQPTFLDDLRGKEKKLERGQELLENRLANFKAEEKQLREQAAQRGRKKMRTKIRQIDPSVKKLNYDPQDIKVIAHPVDLIVFDGLNQGEDVKKVIFINRDNPSEMREARKGIVQSLQNGDYGWETIQVSRDGTVQVK